jgi:regulator of replication initiation timing
MSPKERILGFFHFQHMDTEQTERIAQLEEELRQLKLKYREDLQELSVTQSKAINEANRLEKENHALKLRLQAEIERGELRRKRPTSASIGWLTAILVGLLVALSKC